MSTLANWLVGALAGVLGSLGLLLASRALDAAIYGFGLLLSIFSVLFIFWLVKHAYDEADHRRR